MKTADTAIIIVHLTYVNNFNFFNLNNFNGNVMLFFVSPGCQEFNVKQTLETENKA